MVNMKYYVMPHLDGIALWYGDIEDDYAQFGIVSGEWGFFYNDDLDKIWYDADKEELDYLIFELPGRAGLSKESGSRTSSFQKAIYDFIDFLREFNKDKYDMIKAIFGE